MNCKHTTDLEGSPKPNPTSIMPEAAIVTATADLALGILLTFELLRFNLLVG